MATVTAISKTAADNQTFEAQGHRWFTQIYEATSALSFLKNCQLQHVAYAQLTGAMTINATVTNLEQGQEVLFHFGTDGTQRIVTFGTNFKSSGTVTIPASKGAVVRAVFDGTYLLICSREIWA
jgi:hypothetical protein